jgi:Mn-dependent DtxR family transcriptional regulator
VTERTKDKFSFNDTDEVIISYILNKKKVNAYQIHKKFGIAKSTVHKSLNKLERSDLLSSFVEKGDRKRLYRLSSRWTCVDGTFFCILRDEMKIVCDCPFFETCDNEHHLDDSCALLSKNPEIKMLVKKLMEG